MITAENVLANPLAFKANLAIGEDAYTSLKYGKGLQGLWDSLGIGATAAGIAKTSTVAALVGSKTGWFAAIGIGASTTPLHLVALAAVGSTAAYVGVMRLVRNYSSQRVDVIPKFINTPLDVLAVSLFGFYNIYKFDDFELSQLSLISTTLSFIFSYLTIKYFLIFIRNSSLNFFVIYRLILGSAILIYVY